MSSSVVAENISPTIRIGALLPLSGDYAQYGQEILRGIQLGAADSSAKVIVEDSGTMNKMSLLSAASKLIEIEKVSVLLVLGSDDVQPIVSLSARTSVPIVSLWDNSAALANLGDFVFSTGFSLEGTANLYATYSTKKLGARRVAILGNQSAWSSHIAEEFVRHLDRQRGVVVFRETVPDDFADFGSIVLKLSSKKPDMIFLPLSLPGATLQVIRQLRAAKIEAAIFATESIVGDTIKSLGSHANGIFVGWIAQSDASVVKNYQKKFGSTPSDPGVVEVGLIGVQKVIEAHLNNPGIEMKDALREFFGESRRTARSYKLFQIQSGKLIPVEE